MGKNLKLKLKLVRNVLEKVYLKCTNDRMCQRCYGLLLPLALLNTKGYLGSK